jgi:hypothetical protein
MNLTDKALRVIEAIVSDDDIECAEYDLYLHNELPDKKATRKFVKKLILIYEISHSSIEEYQCSCGHESWRKQTEKLYKKFKKEGLVP